MGGGGVVYGILLFVQFEKGFIFGRVFSRGVYTREMEKRDMAEKNQENNAEMIPDGDLQTALEMCCRNPATRNYYAHAPRGAQAFIALQCYTRVYASRLEESVYQAYLGEIEKTLRKPDVDYLLRGEKDGEVIAYLKDVRSRLGTAEQPATGRSLRRVADAQHHGRLEEQPAPRVKTEYEGMMDAAREGQRRRTLGRICKQVGSLVLLAFLGWLALGPFWKSSDEKLENPPTSAKPVERKTTPTSTPPKVADTASRTANRTPANTRSLPVSFNSCKDKLVAIGNDRRTAGGVGFLVKMDGKTYFVTNEHIARGPDEWFRNLYLMDGTRLEFGSFEVAEGQDLVRMEVKGSFPAFEISAEVPKMEARVVLFGNTARNGTMVESAGQIQAVGAFRLDIDAIRNVGAGHSGSPVLDEVGRVVGTFVYMAHDTMRDSGEKDWGSQAPRVSGVRQGAIRLGSVKWQPVAWEKYREQVETLNDVVAFCKRLVPFIAAQEEGVTGNRFTYGVRYDELSKRMFTRHEDDFRPCLLSLSASTATFAKRQRDLKNALQRQKPDEDDEDVVKKRQAFNVAQNELNAALVKSLGQVKALLEKTEWEVPQFKTDMTDFLPMKWYLEWTDEQLTAQKRLQQKMGEIMQEQKAEAAAQTPLFDRVKNCLAIIKAGDGAGTGFLVKLDGKVWLVTNEHVLRGGAPFSATLPDGRALKFSPTVEVAANRDLARLQVEGDYEALEWFPEPAKQNQKIHVYGNSDGGGVLTEIAGRVLGVGSDRIEVDAKFVQGNSGSAVLDSKGRILAVATYATRRNDPKDWVSTGTRFNGRVVRRFGVRLNGVKWEKVPWKTYVEGARVLNECEMFLDLGRKIIFGKKFRNYNFKGILREKMFQNRFFYDVLSSIAREDEKLNDTSVLHDKLVAKYNSRQMEDDKPSFGLGDSGGLSGRKRRIDDPTDRIKQLAHRLPVLVQRCAVARRKALQNIHRFLGSKTEHEVSRLRDASNEMRKELEGLLDLFDEIFKNELKGPDSTTLYLNQHLR